MDKKNGIDHIDALLSKAVNDSFDREMASVPSAEELAKMYPYSRRSLKRAKLCYAMKRRSHIKHFVKAAAVALVITSLFSTVIMLTNAEVMANVSENISKLLGFDDNVRNKPDYSKTLNDKEVDVYIDASGKEYLFEKDGTFIGFISGDNSVSTTYSASNNYSKEEICEVAKSYAVDIFGSELEQYTVQSVFYQEIHDRYFVTLSKKYGEDGFATGEICNMILKRDGHVISCTIPNHVELENFDESILNGITLSGIKSFAEKEASSLFPTLQSLDLSGINIVKVDNKFALEISYHHVADSIDPELIDEYNIDMAMAGDVCEFMMSYYYPLEP